MTNTELSLDQLKAISGGGRAERVARREARRLERHERRYGRRWERKIGGEWDDWVHEEDPDNPDTGGCTGANPITCTDSF